MSEHVATRAIVFKDMEELLLAAGVITAGGILVAIEPFWMDRTFNVQFLHPGNPPLEDGALPERRRVRPQLMFSPSSTQGE